MGQKIYTCVRENMNKLRPVVIRAGTAEEETDRSRARYTERSIDRARQGAARKHVLDRIYMDHAADEYWSTTEQATATRVVPVPCMHACMLAFSVAYGCMHGVVVTYLVFFFGNM